MKIPRRALLTGSAAMAGFAALPNDADAANVPFTTFQFKSTGSTTPRTQPDRLAEVKNVLDFGADPTGANATATTAAIQAAINWTGGADRGTIYFPRGTYTVNSTLTFNYNGNLTIRFIGESSVITGGISGFLLDRHNVNSGSPSNTPCNIVFEKLILVNTDTTVTSGCVRIGSAIGAFFRDCRFTGQQGVTTEDSVGVSSENILFENCGFSALNQSPFVGTNGIVIGGGGAIIGCDFENIDTGIVAYGNGLHCSGNRTERMNTAWQFGFDSGGNNVGASGFSLTSGTCEGNATAMWLRGTCSGFLIGPYEIEGHNNTNSGYPVPPGENSQYGLRIDAGMASAGVINAVSIGSQMDVASVSIGNASSRANVVFIGCNALQTGGTGASWVNPTNAYTSAFINCNNDPIWTFSQLPTGGNVLEGDEFNISDAHTSGGLWGQTVTGSGGTTTRGLVRWNGTNWTLVGI